MNSDANIAPHLSIGANVNGQQKLTGFVEFSTSIWWMISVEMLITSIVERCFRLGLKNFIPLRKLNYCTNY